MLKRNEQTLTGLNLEKVDIKQNFLATFKNISSKLINFNEENFQLNL